MTSLAGLALLFFISSSIEIEETKIKDVCQNQEDMIKIRGLITQVTKFNKTITMQITQPTVLDAVYFKKNEEDLIKEGAFVQALGYVEEYKGKNQLIIEKIDQS